MCRPISHRNLARMKLAPLGRGSMVLLGAYRRREILGTVDVAHHARIADRNLYQPCFVRGLAHYRLAALGGERLARISAADHHDHARQLGAQMSRGLHGDWHAVRQRMAQLVGAEARGGACREQQADDVQVCLTSQAEGSKRRSGLAAQVGSLTPWRTAVISARIAMAISGGVLEPM